MPEEAGTALRVPFHRVPVDEDDVAAVVEVLRSGWLSTGPQTVALEREVAERLRVPHAVALSSGTAAMHLALESLGVGAGDEVLVPAYTFTATAEVAVYLGARPVLVDVDGRSLNVTAQTLAPHLSARTRAIMPVHIAGVGCEMAPVLELARSHGLAVVEDAAHAFPTQCDAGAAGTLGDAGALSFYATKTMTTGEGGMLLTNRDDVAARARRMALHGIDRNAYDRYQAAGRWYYEVADFGFKYNLGDLAAALGRSQLRRLDDHRRMRAAVAARYDGAFRECDALEVPYRRGDDADSWHLYLLRLHLDRIDCDRSRFIDDLTERGIGASVHFIPLHLHPAYQRHLGYRPGDFPAAEAEYRRVVSLPIWPQMGDADVDAVVEAVLDVARQHVR